MEENRKIDRALEVYYAKEAEIMGIINNQSDNSVHFIINSGNRLSELRIKIACLEIARNN